MNQLKKQLLCLTALVSATHLFGDGTTSKIVPRSQSFNTARQIVGWDNPVWGINRKPQDDNYTSLNLTFEYTRTFRSKSLAQALFGNDLICQECNDDAITISGSAVAGRNGSTDWLADYFGLPRDFQSTVSFKPQIQNYLLEFNLYAGLDAWAKGMYFNIYGPFVHTKWNLNASECVSNAGTAYNGSYFQGYFTDGTVPMSSLNNGFLQYANGATPTGLDEAYDSQAITWESLCCSKISPECGCEGQGLSRNGFAELRFVLGWNFCNDDNGDYHAGAGLYVAAPTGTRVGSQDDCNSTGRYLFEPIVGNGKHWELGGQITAHHIFWKNAEETKSWGLYVEAIFSHLFAASQIRCFDLCSAGSNSRYMLAEQLGSNRNTIPHLPQINHAGVFLDSLQLEFANVYAPVANITRSNVSSTIGAQGDVSFSFAYKCNNFQWDIGYDFWGRSCEKLALEGCCNPAFGQWALKGDQRVFGFSETPASTYSIPATDSQANVHTGSNLANGVDYATSAPTANNFYADNSQSLANVSTTSTSLPVYIDQTFSTVLYTSEQSVLIQQSDFDLMGTRGISNKIFTHFNYVWPEMNESKWTPYVGLGFEAEFGSNQGNCCENPCNTSCETPCAPCNYGASVPANVCSQLKGCCSNVALSQWGIWFKVGTSYN